MLGVGHCTRLLPYIVGEPKVYEAVIRFGAETATDDATGERTVEQLPPALTSATGHAAVLDAIGTLTGVIAQVPPAYSAKHVNGERSYDLARKGRAVALPAATVQVHSWEILEALGDALRVRISCGGGTYIRALARDLGRALESAAHCEALRRVSCGPARVAQATRFETLAPGAIADGDVELLSPLGALGAIATEVLDDRGEVDLARGRALRATRSGETVAFLRAVPTPGGAASNDVLGIGVRIEGDRWQPRVVLLGPDA